MLSFCFLNSYAELPAPYILQEVRVSIINNSRCNDLFQQPNFFYRLADDVICAGSEDGKHDACKVSAPAPVRALLETGPAPSTLGLRATPMASLPSELVNEEVISPLLTLPIKARFALAVSLWILMWVATFSAL